MERHIVGQAVRRAALCAGVTVLVALGAAESAPAQAPRTPLPGAIRTGIEHRSGVKPCPTPSGTGVVVGGPCRWTTHLTYYVIPNANIGKLTLSRARPFSGFISVRKAARSGRLGPILDAAGAWSSLTFEVRDALPRTGGRVVLVIAGGSPKVTTRFATSSLLVRSQYSRSTNEPLVPVVGNSSPVAPPPPDPVPDSPPAGDSAPAPPAVAPQRPPGDQVVAAVPTNGTAVWVSRSELMSRPMSGPQWADLKLTADSAFGKAKLAAQDSNHDMRTMAAALVWARSAIASYRAKAAAAIDKAIGTERGGRTLALGRNLAGYVVAADLIDLPSFDAAADKRFRTWLAAVRDKDLKGLTLLSTHETRPNNWGAMAGVSRIAAALYLGDTADLNRAATVFKGYTGDRSAYAGFEFGGMSWQADSSAPVPINPAGATKAGFSLDGALPDDMRRGCGLQVPPCWTSYAWEAMQGIIMQADLLSHHGFPAFAWSDNAVYRAARFLRNLDAQYGGWWVTGDDIWQPSVLNHAYGRVFPSDGTGAGKVFGWTDWVYGT